MMTISVSFRLHKQTTYRSLLCLLLCRLHPSFTHFLLSLRIFLLLLFGLFFYLFVLKEAFRRRSGDWAG
jgi:hypothetical protein